MSKLKSLEELFAGRHFDREVILMHAPMRPLAAVEDHAPSSGGIVATRGTPATGSQHCWQWSWPLVPGPRESPFCRTFQCILPLARSSFVIREPLA
jgi:hypothetical protein